jgi:hypothetical protein
MSGAKAEVGSGMPRATTAYDRPIHERDAVVARGADTGTVEDERAQPGDVIGVETGGETTHIGDTAEDENKRREAAEKDADKIRNNR